MKPKNPFCFQKFLFCKLCTTFPFYIGKLFFCITAFSLISTADYHFHIFLPHSIFISQNNNATYPKYQSHHNLTDTKEKT